MVSDSQFDSNSKLRRHSDISAEPIEEVEEEEDYDEENGDYGEEEGEEELDEDHESEEERDVVDASDLQGQLP